MVIKKDSIPVEHRVIWEFGAGAGINAIWQGEWRKKWFSNYEWKIIIDDELFPEPYETWKPVEHIIYDYDVKSDLRKYNLKFKE
jgi:hypothetical protein